MYSDAKIATGLAENNPNVLFIQDVILVQH